MLCLLFSQEMCKSDNVGIDLLLPYSTSFAIGRHFAGGLQDLYLFTKFLHRAKRVDLLKPAR